MIINHSIIDQNTCNLRALATPQALSQNEDTDPTGTKERTTLWNLIIQRITKPISQRIRNYWLALVWVRVWVYLGSLHHKRRKIKSRSQTSISCDDKSDVCFRTGSASVTANAAATNGLDGPDMANNLTNPTVTATNPKASTADDTLTNPTATNPIATNPTATNPTATNPTSTDPTVTEISPTSTNPNVADPTGVTSTGMTPTVDNSDAVTDPTGVTDLTETTIVTNGKAKGKKRQLDGNSGSSRASKRYVLSSTYQHHK